MGAVTAEVSGARGGDSAGRAASDSAGQGRSDSAGQGRSGSAGQGEWSPPLPAVLAAAVLGVWITLDIVLAGPWHRADIAVADWVDALDLRGLTVPNAVLWLLSQSGGRATILVVVGLLTVYIMRERRVWQPLLRVLVAFTLLTVVIYAFKIGLGRTAPGYGASVLYVDGRSYPSGHSANAVLWWGLAVWLARSYDLPGWVVRLFTVVAVAAPILTSLSMLALNYHWLTDVLAGLALGLVLLRVLHLIFNTRLGEWGSAPRQGRAGGRGRDRVLAARSGAGG